jgi:hypothetical protein
LRAFVSLEYFFASVSRFIVSVTRSTSIQ